MFYKPLTKDNISHIVDLQLAELQKRLKDKQLSVKLTDAARQYIIDGGYDPIYGARPLKRFMQAKIETLLARKMIAEDLAPGTEITVDYGPDEHGEMKLTAR